MSDPLRTLWGRRIAGIPLRWVVVFALAFLLPPLHSLATRESYRVETLPDPPRDVHLVRPDLREFVERLYQARQASLDRTTRCRRLALHELGMVAEVEPPFDAGYGGAGASGGLTRAFYLQGSDTIFVRTSARSAARHEYVHAVDDQFSGRLAEARESATTDEHLALRAVIEGTAQMAMGSAPIGGGFTGDFDANAWRFVYGVGPRYVSEASGDDLASALTLTPRSTYTLLFSHPPDTITDLPRIPGARCQDRLGIVGVLSALATAGASPEEAMVVARAWAGDRLAYLGDAGPDATRVRWTVVFTSQHAARLWRNRAAGQLQLRHDDVAINTRVLEGVKPPPALESLLQPSS